MNHNYCKSRKKFKLKPINFQALHYKFFMTLKKWIFRANVLQIVIEVLDANDNSPRFSRAHYDTAVAESDLPGKVLFKLSASDADLGANGLVRYFLSPNSASQHGKLFTVDEDDGRVVLAGDLDRERSSVYEVAMPSFLFQLNSFD